MTQVQKTKLRLVEAVLAIQDPALLKAVDAQVQAILHKPVEKQLGQEQAERTSILSASEASAARQGLKEIEEGKGMTLEDALAAMDLGITAGLQQFIKNAKAA